MSGLVHAGAALPQSSHLHASNDDNQNSKKARKLGLHADCRASHSVRKLAFAHRQRVQAHSLVIAV